jgi:hypothetical protein
MDLYVVQSGPFPPQGSAKARDRLFHNEGGKRFVDVTEKAGIRDTSYGLGAAAADFDNDGNVDLFVSNYGGNILYRNDGNGTFTDVTSKSGVDGPRFSTAAAWGDYDGDGDLDPLRLPVRRRPEGQGPLLRRHPHGRPRLLSSDHVPRHEPARSTATRAAGGSRTSRGRRDWATPPGRVSACCSWTWTRTSARTSTWPTTR